MGTKMFKSNLFSIGVVSAISAAGLLLGGWEAKAQMTDSNRMNPMDQNRMNQIDRNQMNPMDQNRMNPMDQNRINQPLQNNPTPGTPSTTTTSPISQYSPNQAPLLTVGSQGAAVRDLQAFLNQRGYYDYAVDGIYGSRTQAAVREFQEAQNLMTDGIVGPRTWGALTNSDNAGTANQF